VQAAIEIQDALHQVNESRRKRGVKYCGAGIGLHRGEVLHGSIGSADRLEFTVIGEAVNKTSRISDGAASGEILLSPALYSAVEDSYQCKKTSIETKHEGTFEVWSLKQSKNRKFRLEAWV